MNEKQNNKTFSFWEALENAEIKAEDLIHHQLSSFTDPFVNCYEAGVRAPFLPLRRYGALDLRVAGLFLKRTLTDLRVIWLLCIRGYTGQAMTVASSLLENAIAVELIAGDKERAKRIFYSNGGELPWSMREMSKMRADKRQALASERGESFTKEDYKSLGEATYFNYRWLCKFKHPTIPALLHEAGSSRTKEKHEYIIMAFPDVDDKDIKVKGFMLIEIVIEACAAIRALVEAGDVEKKSNAYREYDVYMSKVNPGLNEAFQSISKYESPIILDKDSFKVRSYHSRFSKKSRKS